MSMSDGLYPWANFGEPDRSQSPDSDLPTLHVPLLPQMLPPMQQMMELDLTGEPVVESTGQF